MRHWTALQTDPAGMIQHLSASITGATDGIGKGYAQVLAKQGCNLCLFVRNSEKAELLKKELIDINKKIEI